MPQKKEAICGSGKKALARRKFVPPTLTIMLEYSETTPETVCPEKMGMTVCCQKRSAGSSPITKGRKNCAIPISAESAEPYVSALANDSLKRAVRNMEKATKNNGKKEKRKSSLRTPHETCSAKKRENAERKKTAERSHVSGLAGTINDRRISDCVSQSVASPRAKSLDI